MPKLIIQLVTWNGEKYIPYIFHALKGQVFQDFHLYIFDNGSTDGTRSIIDQELQSVSFSYTYEKNDSNIGFAGGHNHVFQKTSDMFQHSPVPYIFLLNQDVYLTYDCLARMISFFDAHADVASVSPRLMQWNFYQAQLGDMEKSFTSTIDSLGLKVHKNRRVTEKYAGKTWDTIKSRMTMSFRTEDDGAMEVFGVSGATPMYRREALEHISLVQGTFFDPLYHSYKEDVDVAYRLRIAGYSSCVLLDTLAYHDRTTKEGEKKGDISASRNKKTQSHAVRYHSYKNHLMMLYTSEYVQNALIDGWRIAWYEVKKFVWFFMFDRSILRAWQEIWQHRRHVRAKRRTVLSSRRTSWRDLRAWWI